jgi:lactoylglutathione lyase
MMVRTGLTLLALISAATASAQSAPPAPAVADVEIAGPVLMVTDLERSLKFYQHGIGLVVGTRLPGNPGPGATVTARAGSPAPFLLLRQQSAEAAKSAPIQQGNGLSRVMLVVADSEAVAARLDRAGYAHTPVTDRKVFFVSDPDGYRLEIMQRNSRH